jgi:hypothetical protein
MCGSKASMITDCFGIRQWNMDGTEELFVQGVCLLTRTLLIPVAIFVFTWKFSQTGRAHERASLLGLNETSRQKNRDRQES